MRSSPRFVAVAVVAVAIGVFAGFSCKTFDLPSDTCDPSHLHGGMLSAGLSDSTCNRCLEDRCCEQVGLCSRTDGCTQVVSSVHACVIDAKLMGAQDENECARRNMLVPKTTADDAYRCMRGECGEECGLPVCRVDRSGMLIQNARCDACFSSSCCSELNACYGSRACKLIVECIASSCGPKLGASLSGAPLGILAGIDAGTFDLCADAGGMVARPGGPQVPDCVKNCVCLYRMNDQGLTPSDPELQPDRLSLKVYTCGQLASCGSECLPTDDASDAAPEAASEAGSDAADASSDAASDAASDADSDAP